MDHTSEKVVYVKMFVDQEAWEELEAAVPGEMVILTNLVSVFHEAEFSHLESSNQTSVFSGESTRDSRLGCLSWLIIINFFNGGWAVLEILD